MGITRLAEFIALNAPNAISRKDISDYTGKIVALDTFVLLNQFRAVTPTLSPLRGLFNRTLTFLEHDIKPVFVFDGKPPREKTPVLEKRAQVVGWKYINHTGAASSQTKDCFQLLKLLGVPVIQAPGDAEALCAQLVKEGTVDAVASEDMDTLPFGATILICQLNAKRDSEVIVYSLPKLLETLQINHEEFVDLCILLGCDYCDKIAGLGPKKALPLIQKHRTIENVVLHHTKTHQVPEFWKYKEARKIFLDTPQTVAPELTWTEPDKEALVEFLCPVAHITKDRIHRRMEKFHQTRQDKRDERATEKAAGSSRQSRMEDFFRVTRKRKMPVEAADNRQRPKSK